MIRKYILMLTVFIMIGLQPGLFGGQIEGGDKDKELLEKAKLELFDRNWNSALKKLDQIVKTSSNSSYYPLALFYKGKCLEEQKKSTEALVVYNEYLKISTNKSLREEATIAIIDLNYSLYKNGEKQYLKKITEFLKSKERTVRYYAAIKLSHAEDKKLAGAAVPVLKKIVELESDEELVDRAKLALMRINPSYLNEFSRTRNIEKRSLNIRIYHKKLKKETFSINIPFALAKLALEALPDEEKILLEKKGYNLDKLLNTLSDIPEIIRIEGEDIIFKIWVE